MSPEIIASILFLNGIMLAIIGFFAKSLITKLDSAVKSLNGLDKNIAVIIEKIHSQNNNIEILFKQDEVSEKEIKSIRERLHKYGNELNKVMLEKELLNG